jgi:hypothetical protein
MTLRHFIRENRELLDACIKSTLGNFTLSLNDQDRREWILNQEDLYNWARRAGVRI